LSQLSGSFIKNIPTSFFLLDKTEMTTEIATTIQRSAKLRHLLIKPKESPPGNVSSEATSIISQTASPRRKLGLTFEQKRRICVFHGEHPEMKQHDLIKHFTKQFGLPYRIPKSTISGLLKNKTIYLTQTYMDLSNKKKSKALYPQLEEALYTWYLNEKSMGVNVVDNQLIEKAEELCKTLSLDGFKCSTGWLYRFKNRYDLNEVGKNGVKMDENDDNDDDLSQNNISEYMNETGRLLYTTNHYSLK
jgi:hypothetical protein